MDCGGIKINITYNCKWNLQMRSRFTIWIKVKGLNVLLLHPWSSPAKTHLWILGRMCLVDMCGLFSLSAELFMLLTPQWSTPSTWASNISVEIKKKGVGCREVGQGGVDPEGIRGVFKASSVCCTMTLGSMKAKVLKTDNTFFSCVKSKCAVSSHSWVADLKRVNEKCFNRFSITQICFLKPISGRWSRIWAILYIWSRCKYLV